MIGTVLTFVLLGVLAVSVAGLVLYALAELWFWMDEQDRSKK
jgi:phage shock protein PspC (stress-responsive transcriptional regulator)